MTHELSAEDLSLLRKGADEHKFDHGSALVLTGPATRSGAGRLAGMGALRVGAGLVTLGGPRDALAECAAQITALMLREVSEALDLTLLLAEDSRINALCIGPGFGLGAEQAATLKAALATRRACVLDADALTLMAQDRAVFAELHQACVLTPHGGEFRRLFPGLGEDTQPFTLDEKRDATQRAADLSGAVVLYKGAETVVAEPGGEAVTVDTRKMRHAAWLATAGAGDVLAGIITGLLARGATAGQAAELGAWLHGLAAEAIGPGLIAEDLPGALPRVFRDIGV